MKEFWIYKGASNFCSELVYDVDTDSYKKARPDGFYDIVSERDTVEGGVHVVEYSEYEKILAALKDSWEDLHYEFCGETCPSLEACIECRLKELK